MSGPRAHATISASCHFAKMAATSGVYADLVPCGLNLPCVQPILNA